MADDLRILLSASLNVGKSVGDLNTAIKAIESHPSLKKISLKIDIDQKFTQSINSFINAVGKMKTVSDEQNKVISQSEEVYKKLDGTITTVTQKVLKNGEVIQKTKTVHDENKKAMQDESVAAQKLAETIEKQNKAELDSITVLKNKANAVTGYSVTSSSGYSVTSQRLESDAQTLIGSSTITNYKKQREDLIKEQQRLIREAEALDRDHYNALKTNNARIEAEEKQHYLALQQNAKRDLDFKQSIADRQAKINDLMRRFGSDHNVKSQLEVSTKSLSGISNIGDYKTPLREFDTNLKNIAASANSARSNVISFGEALKTAMERFPVWMAASTIFFQSLHFFTEGIRYVNEFNATLTQIGTAVNYNVEKQQQLAQSFQKLGNDISATTADVSKAALEFYRQGLSDEQVIKRLEITTKYAKISGLEFKQSAELLTAASNSMNTDINKVADTFTLLGDLTATSASEIGVAFQKVGGTAYSLKVPFDKVASYIATISAQTRESAETVGSAVKSIFSRIGSIRERGYDAEDGTSVNQVAKALAAAQVELIDSQGQFRNFATVLDELGEKWNTIDDRTRRYIATVTAGTYQQSRFLTLMDSYGKSVELYNQALDSTGTTQQKYNIYLEGTQAHIDKLLNIMQGLWSNTFNSNAIKTVIDSLGGLLSGIDSIVKKFGFLPPVIFAASTALLLFNTRFKELAAQGWAGAFASLVGGFNRATGAMIAFDVAAVGARLSAIALQATLSLGLSLAITAVVSGITMMISKQQELAQDQKKFEDQQKLIADNWINHKDKISELLVEYNKLSQISNRSTEQDEKFLKVQTDLSALLPNLTQNIDQKGQAHLKSSEAIAKELENTEKLAKAEQNRQLASSKDSFKEILDKKAEIQDKIDLLQSQIKNKTTSLLGESTTQFDKMSEADLATAKVKLLGLQSQIADANGKIKESLTSLAETAVGLAGVKVSDNLNKELREVVNSLQLEGLKPEELTAKVGSLSTIIQKLNNIKELRAGTSPDATDSAAAEERQFISLAKAADLTDKQINKLMDSMFGFKKATQDAQQSAGDIQNKIVGIYESTAEKVRPLNDALDKMANSHKLTSSEVLKLIKDYPELLSSIEYENGLAKISANAIEKVRDARIEDAKIAAKTEADKLKAQEDALVVSLGLYETEITAIESLAQAKEALSKAQANVQSSGSDMEQANRMQFIGSITNQILAIGKAKDSLKGLQDAAKNGFRFENTNNTSDNPESRSLPRAIDSKDKTQEFINSANSEYVAIDANNKAIEKRISLLEKEKDYAGVIDQETELIIKRKTAIDALNKSNKELNDRQYELMASNQEIAGYDEINSWFDSVGNGTQAYANALEKISQQSRDLIGNKEKLTPTESKELERLKDKYKQTEELFAAVQKLSKAQQDNVDKIDRENQAIDSNTQAIQKNRDEIKRLIDDLDKKAIKAHDDWVDSTTKTLKDVEDEYKKTYKELTDIEDKRHKDRIKNLEDEQRQYDETVDDIIKGIDRQTATENYTEELTAKEKEHADLTNKMKILELGNDVDTKEQRQKVQDDLDKVDREIEKLKRDRQHDTVKQGLQDLKDAKKKEVDTQKDAENQKHDAIKENLDNTLNDVRVWDQLTLDVFAGHTEAVKNTFQTMSNNIKSIINDIGKNLTSNLVDPLNKAGSDFNSNIGGKTQKVEYATGQASSGNPVYSGGNTKGDDWLGGLTPDQKSGVEAGQSNGTKQDWELKLDRARIDNEYAKSEITRAKQVYEEKKALGDMAGAEAAHTWADQIRAVNKIVAADPLFSAETGGMTPAFSGGKFLLAHEKELILNKFDTSNILKAVDITRNFLTNMKMPDLGGIISKNLSPANQPKILQIQGNLIHVDKMDRDTDLDSILNQLDMKLKSNYGFSLG